jgi:lipopolysaccharide export system protein LptA
MTAIFSIIRIKLITRPQLLFVGFSVFTCLTLSTPCFSQVRGENKKEKIKLDHADELEGDKRNGEKVNILRGNVAFSQKTAKMYCDSAYQYKKRNSIDAFGHVRINQGDSINLTGNTLNYNGDTKLAIVKGNVVLKDRKMTLTTDALNYDMKAKMASYNSGGRMKDQDNTLTSQNGSYSTESKTLYFKKNVKVVNTKQGFSLSGEDLEYNTITKIITYRGPTTIVNQEGTITSNYGQYNTSDSSSVIEGESKVKSGNFLLTADQMQYNGSRKPGVATGHVKMVSEKDNIIIEGDKAYYWESTGLSKIFGHPVMKSISGTDTLFLTADTLISIDNPNKNQRKLYAYNHTKIFRSDLQGKCDSLVYNFSDSTIYFFNDPVLWNGGNQIFADSINIQLANKKISRMNMNINSFIISRDSLSNYNQIKGRRMIALFNNNSISRVDVKGNGESIYFALENDSALVGMNKVACSDITIGFLNEVLNSISFIKSPDAQFIPPHELQEPDKRLKGFAWRERERPTRRMVVRKE